MWKTIFNYAIVLAVHRSNAFICCSFIFDKATMQVCKNVLEKYVCGCIFLHVYDKNKLGHKSFLRFQQIQTPH